LTSHVFDTSIWLKVWKQHPPDIYVTLWSKLEAAASASTICSPEDVKIEIERGSDGLADHIGKWPGLFVPVEAIWQQSRDVLAACPSLCDESSTSNQADPFVVALGIERRGIVVSGETPRKAPGGRLKIPDACERFGVAHFDWFSFLRANGWKL